MTEQRDELFVSEFYQLKGYNVETNIALRSARGGGRNEADVVGHRRRGKSVEIVHVEVGNLGSTFENSLEVILKKFDNKVRQSVVDYITHIKREIDPIDDTWTYECIYVFTYCSEKSRLQLEPALREFGIELKSIESLYDELPEVVDQLKRLRVTHGFSKNENITVPQNIVVSYHLLRLLEHLGKT